MIGAQHDREERCPQEPGSTGFGGGRRDETLLDGST